MSGYKIIILLSRHNISFEFILDGQKVPSHMPKGKWPAPLAFFATDKGIIVGHEAARAAKSGTYNAFDNYFELISTDATYSSGSNTEPIRKIFLEGAEAVFENFFQSVLFNRNGKLFENRDKMPLYIVCEADVKDEERIHIKTLFTEAGYKHVSATYMNDSLAELAKTKHEADYVLTVWADGFDLSLNLFDTHNGGIVEQKLVPELGRDPRVDRLYRNVWGQIVSNNSFLNAEIEKPQLMDVVTAFMNSPKYEEYQTVVLSDHEQYHVLLQRPQMLDSDESKRLRCEIADMLSRHGASRANTAIALRGIAATNEFFYDNVGDGWRLVNRTNIDLRNEALLQLLAKPSDAGGTTTSTKPELPESGDTTQTYKPEPDKQKLLAELKKKWRIVSATAKGLWRVEKFDIAISQLVKFKEEIPSGEIFAPVLKEVEVAITMAQNELKRTPDNGGPTPPPSGPTPPPPDDDKLLKDWQRKKKVCLADANGKVRVGAPADAIKVCQDFLATIPTGDAFDNMRTEVRDKIAEYQKLLTPTKPEKAPTRPTVRPAKPTAKSPQPLAPTSVPPKPTVSKQSKEPTPAPPKSAAPTGEGYRLIKEGKLRDARDWFKEHSQSEVVKKLSKLIREQQSIRTYSTKDLPQLKAKRDKARLAEILNDVKSYIESAQELGFIDTDAYSLLKELHKLK